MKNALKILGFFSGLILIGALLVIGFIFGLSKITPYKYEVPKPIYRPGTVWKFSASFFNPSNELLSVDTLLATIHDERIMMQQNKMTWEIQGKPNTKMPTGIIENQLRLCLHPPTFNFRYQRFTQFSAYPEIHFPIAPNKNWEGKIRLQSLATKETGQALDYTSKIINIDTLDEKTKNVSIIGQLEAPRGLNTNLITYKDRVGFTRVEYVLANEEKLILELVSRRNL